MMMMIITTTTYNNNTLIIMGPLKSLHKWLIMIALTILILFNDNMWSTSLLFLLLNSENREHLKNSRNADLS